MKVVTELRKLISITSPLPL